MSSCIISIICQVNCGSVLGGKNTHELGKHAYMYRPVSSQEVTPTLKKINPGKVFTDLWSRGEYK